MGLELAGVVVRVGSECKRAKVGDRVACLVGGKPISDKAHPHSHETTIRNLQDIVFHTRS